MWDPSLWIAGHGGSIISRKIQGLVTLLGYQPEIEDRTILLKTQYTMSARCKQSKLEMNWKILPAGYYYHS